MLIPNNNKNNTRYYAKTFIVRGIVFIFQYQFKIILNVEYKTEFDNTLNGTNIFWKRYSENKAKASGRVRGIHFIWKQRTQPIRYGDSTSVYKHKLKYEYHSCTVLLLLLLLYFFKRR